MSNVEKLVVLKLDIFWQNIYKFSLWYVSIGYLEWLVQILVILEMFGQPIHST
jgi:hypothetical protein